MKLPSSCLGVLNLRQGSFVIGVVQLGLNCLSLLACIVAWVVLSTLAAFEHRIYFALIFGPALAVALLHITFSVLLIVGTRREQPGLLLAWLVFQGIVIVLSLVAAVVTFVLALHMSEYVLLAAVAGVLGGAVLLAYCFVVVLAYWRELRRAPTHTVVVRQPDMVKMVDIA